MEGTDRHNDWSVIAQWAATILAIVLLESHIVSRPFAYSVAPLISLVLIAIVRPTILRNKLFWALTICASVGGFLWAKYLLR